MTGYIAIMHDPALKQWLRSAPFSTEDKAQQWVRAFDDNDKWTFYDIERNDAVHPSRIVE